MTGTGAGLAPRRRRHGPLGRLHGPECRREEEGVFDCECPRCLLCGLDEDHPRYLEEGLAMLMVSLAWTP